MNIVVCIKIYRGEINPFDAAALETALRLDDAATTVLCMGPKNVLHVLEDVSRLGDFRTILLSDEAFVGSDTLATSYVLSLAVKKMNADLVFCGRQSIDGETAQVGPSLAARLGLSLIPNVLEFGMKTCNTRNGPADVSFPALLTFERICDLRFPSIRSKKKFVEIWDRTKIDADPARCGLAGSPTRVLETFEPEKGRRNCRFIDWNELETVLDELKRTETKTVSETTVPCENRFPEIWTIGEEIVQKAETLADRVVVVPRAETGEIAGKIRAENPEIVLWNADAEGRNTAPQVAAMLEAGLCADCTELKISVENKMRYLDMYRPALGGNVVARIRCRTRPVMATVRTAKKTNEILVGCGRGVADRFEEAKIFAQNIGAGLCASRGLVDTGIASYEMQVGLTGKHVAPKVYIALGISGTVQHLCGIENSETIIAVNPDREARIFEYADYGVVGRFEPVNARCG